MRGRDDRSEGLFSYAAGGAHSGGSPVAGGPQVGGRGLGGAERAFRGAVLVDGPAFDRARDAAAGDAAAGLLLGALRADADGADQLQPVVPLVCRPAARWRGVACDGVHALLEAEVARDFLSALLGLPQVKALLSDEHFSVDGTLIEAWASMEEL